MLVHGFQLASLNKVRLAVLVLGNGTDDGRKTDIFRMDGVFVGVFKKDLFAHRYALALYEIPVLVGVSLP